MKFLKIENKILNTAQIESVCINKETVRVDYQGDESFGTDVKEDRGIRVYMVGAHENSYFVFESETIESFYEKLVAA
ncbi:hypothetical protein [Acinetobacter variabilis]|uniref:Uncharacterized protein n=1 Tax=Acinetobacter variabilis TaxID=70346 RepID=N9MJM9_9GAMM|nr:hypothetical protein [Acinetobacter variabilis]ENX08844.1 hypothetical protein F897_01995 [Acinetobacter variabilis]UBI30994.1 hypothetical protein LA331_02140 [Acinetobacter variabilis]